MRTIFHLLLLYLFLLPFGCTSSESSSRTLTEVSPIVITGKVTGTDEPIPLVYSTRYSRGISTMEDGGNFEFTFQTDQPEIFSMNYQLQRWHVFAMPGDTIDLEFDHFDMINFGEPIQYAGDCVEENERLNQLRSLLQYGESVSSIYYRSQNDFIAGLDKALTDFQIHAEKEILNNENLSSEFRRYITGYGHSIIDLHLELYYRNQQSPDRDLTGIRKLKEQLPASFINHPISEYGKGLLGVAPYRTLHVMSVYNKLTQEHELNPQPNSFSGPTNAYNLTAKVYNNREIVEGIRFEILKGHYTALGFSTIEELTDEFIRDANHRLYVTSINDYRERWKLLSGKERAPDFTFPDIFGNLYSLDSLEGKNLYVDVWATWCSPCRDERPHFENLISDYEDSDKISFIGISIDRDTAAWSKMIQFHEMKGLQLYAGVESSFREDYQIRPIPHFLLIDAEGYIVDYKAPPPSSEKIRERIDALID